MPSYEELLKQLQEEEKPKVAPICNKNEVQLQHFLNSIQKVEKIVAEAFDEEGRFRFFIKLGSTTKVIEMPVSDFLKGPGRFSSLYATAFTMLLPNKLTQKPKKNESSNWLAFVDYVFTIAVEVEQSETDAYNHLTVVMNKIVNSPITEDKKKWADPATGHGLVLKMNYEGTIYYLVKSADIGAFIIDTKMTTTLEKIGRMMSQKQYKRIKNPNVYLGLDSNHKEIRVYSVWWMTEESLKLYGFDPENPKTEIDLLPEESTLIEFEP